MARLGFGGFEHAETGYEGLTATGAPTFTSSQRRDPNTDYSAQCAPGQFFGLPTAALGTGATGRFLRFAMYATAYPTSGTQLLIRTIQSAANRQTVHMTTTGAVSVGASVSAAGTIPLNAWCVLEVFLHNDGSHVSVRVDGTTTHNNVLGGQSGTPGTFQFGNISGNGGTIYFDDWIWQDDTTAGPNNSWPGTTAVIAHAYPASDLAVGSAWRKADGTTVPSGDAYDEVNDVPATGVAPTHYLRTTSGSGTTVPANDADFTLESYSQAVGGANGTVKCTRALCRVSTNNGGFAGSAQVGVKSLSHPADAAEGVATPGSFTGTGLYPTGWAVAAAPINESPGAAFTDNPTLRFGRRSNTSGVWPQVLAAAIKFEYDPIVSVAQDLSPAYWTGAATVFEPELTQGGTQDLQPDIFTNPAPQVFAPALIVGQPLEPATLANPEPEVFAPTLERHQVLALDLIDAAVGLVFWPELQRRQVLSPSPFATTSPTVFSPELQHATVLQPALLTNTGSVVRSPSLRLGTLIFPTRTDGASQVFMPRLIQGTALRPAFLQKGPDQVYAARLVRGQPIRPGPLIKPPATVFPPANLILGQPLRPTLVTKPPATVFSPRLQLGQPLEPALLTHTGIVVRAPVLAPSQSIVVGPPATPDTHTVFPPALVIVIPPIVEADPDVVGSYHGGMRAAK